MANITEEIISGTITLDDIKEGKLSWGPSAEVICELIDQFYEDNSLTPEELLEGLDKIVAQAYEHMEELYAQGHGS